SPDGSRLVTLAGSNARIWDARTGTPIGEPLQHSGRIFVASYSRNGSRIVTASLDQTAKVWNAANGRLISTLAHPSSALDAQLSPDGKSALTFASGGIVRLWDVDAGQAVNVMPRESNITTGEFSPDGRRLVTGSADGVVQIWDSGTGGSESGPLLHEDRI